MICEHEYPLSMVDHHGFHRFCSYLQPLFKMVSRNTIRNDIVAMHSTQKEKMVVFLQVSNTEWLSLQICGQQAIKREVTWLLRHTT